MRKLYFSCLSWVEARGLVQVCLESCVPSRVMLLCPLCLLHSALPPRETFPTFPNACIAQLPLRMPLLRYETGIDDQGDSEVILKSICAPRWYSLEWGRGMEWGQEGNERGLY